jgi:AcrR family transcriptional regulator
MQAKNGYHHGDLRRALVEAALDIIATEGIRGLSLRKAARLAGVSHAAPAHHFEDLTGLLAAVAERGFEDIYEAMRQAVFADPDGGPAERLNALGKTYVLYAAANPASFRAMFHPMLADRSAYPSLDAAGMRPFRLLLECVADCREAGLLGTHDDMESALFAWSGVHGLATLIVDGYTEAKGFPQDATSMAEIVTSLITAGLRG